MAKENTAATPSLQYCAWSMLVLDSAWPSCQTPAWSGTREQQESVVHNLRRVWAPQHINAPDLYLPSLVRCLCQHSSCLWSGCSKNSAVSSHGVVLCSNVACTDFNWLLCIRQKWFMAIIVVSRELVILVLNMHSLTAHSWFEAQAELQAYNELAHRASHDHQIYCHWHLLLSFINLPAIVVSS